jgi:hypothetical protein
MILPLNQVLSLELPEVGYFQLSTISFEWEDLEISHVEFADSTGAGALKIFHNAEGVPVCYGQDIFTSVCFDNQCRPLSLMVFWNVTGRYLGFRLPKQEFLSRYDHEPFSIKDYEELNSLLADPYLPLGNVAFQELIDHRNDSIQEIDGVSGATSARILDYVVKGAAYTTFTMWNIVHGPMKKLVERRTENEMTSELLALILQSPVADDQIWGLKKIDQSKELDAILEETLLELIGQGDFFVAYSAIEMISPLHLKSEDFQFRLFLKYDDAQYSLKREILKKLLAAPSIGNAVIEKSRDMLVELNGEQLAYMLEVYSKHGIDDAQTCASVAALLHAENIFIAKKASDYLSQVEDLNDDIMVEMKHYSSNQK